MADLRSEGLTGVNQVELCVYVGVNVRIYMYRVPLARVRR